MYKQFTYARNVIQWNLYLFLDECKAKEQNEERAKGTNILRDDVTEGYNIIPNFFISAKQKDLKMHSEIEWIDRDNKDFASRQFENRLFDRDTLLVCHYDVNFLYVVALYGRKNEGMKASWRETVKEQFRREIQSMLQEKYTFYAMTPREGINAEEFLKENFQELLGKVFTPYATIAGQQYFSLALQQDNFEHENAEVLALVEKAFYCERCNLGEDPSSKLPKVTQTAATGKKSFLTAVVNKSDKDYSIFFEHQATLYVMEKIPTNIDLSNIKYLLPMVGGCIDGFYDIAKFSVGSLKKKPILRFNLGQYHNLGKDWIYIYSTMRPGEALTARQVEELYHK